VNKTCISVISFQIQSIGIGQIFILVHPYAEFSLCTVWCKCNVP